MLEVVKSTARGTLNVVSGTAGLAKNITLATSAVAMGVMAFDTYTWGDSAWGRLNSCNKNFPTIGNLASAVEDREYCRINDENVNEIFRNQALALPVVFIGSSLIAYTFSKIESGAANLANKI